MGGLLLAMSWPSKQACFLSKALGLQIEFCQIPIKRLKKMSSTTIWLLSFHEDN